MSLRPCSKGMKEVLPHFLHLILIFRVVVTCLFSAVYLFFHFSVENYVDNT